MEGREPLQVKQLSTQDKEEDDEEKADVEEVGSTFENIEELQRIWMI